MKFIQSFLILFIASTSANAQVAPRTPDDIRRLQRRAVHKFTLTNNCAHDISPRIADTSCGYSPRCADAGKYTAPQPRTLKPRGDSDTITMPPRWVGRVFAADPKCGPKGEQCTMTEFNLDANDVYAPNSYDISNIQGFTQSIQIIGHGCPTVTCKDPSCSCSNAYRIGDMSGCGNDSPVKACKAGDVDFTIVFCP